MSLRRALVAACLTAGFLAGCGDGGDDAAPTSGATVDQSTSGTGTTVAPVSIELKHGTPLLEDDLTTPAKGGWPQTNEQWEVRHDRVGAALKAKTTGMSVWSPEVAAAKATDVAVVADMRGIALSLSFDDAWGVACRREGNSFYAFALTGGGDDGAKPGTKSFNWGIFRYEGGSATRMAGGKVDLGGSLFTVEGQCYDSGPLTALRLLVNTELVGQSFDQTPLSHTGTGIVLQSKSGNSNLSIEKFAIFAVGPA